MSVVSSGQITIIDQSDAPVLTAHITSTLGNRQVYNPGNRTWNPSFASHPLTLELHLRRAGSDASILSGVEGNITWSRQVGAGIDFITTTSTSASEYKSGEKHSELTVRRNIAESEVSILYSASGKWRDPITNLLVEFYAEYTVSLVHLGQSAEVVNFYTPNGTIFHNKNASVTTLNIVSDLYSGGALSNVARRNRWYVRDATQTDNKPDVGIGWRLISSTTRSEKLPYVKHNPTSNVLASGEITIPHEAVINVLSVQGVVEVGVGTPNPRMFREIITLVDYNDPVMVSIESSAGNVFKNSMGETRLRARLFQSGEEVDTAGTKYKYKWYKYNANGSLVNNYGGANTAFKTGKEIAVTAAEVQSKAVFQCEVET